VIKGLSRDDRLVRFRASLKLEVLLAGRTSCQCGVVGSRRTPTAAINALFSQPASGSVTFVSRIFPFEADYQTIRLAVGEWILPDGGRGNGSF